MSKTYDELKRAEYARHSVNSIGSELCIRGDVLGSGNLVMEGSVEGFINLENGILTVGAAARVIADIVAREVIVFGEVQGNISAGDRIEIKNRGLVIGDLATARFVIEEGASFKGSMEIISAPDASRTIPEMESAQPEEQAAKAAAGF